MASRKWRNRVSPGQREFFPKRKPSDEQKALGLRHIAEIRAKLGWDKKG